MNSIRLSALLLAALFARNLAAVDFTHSPPNMRTSLGVVTIEVVAPKAQEIRLLTVKPGFGILRLPLSNESGVFRVRTRGRDLLGRRYLFQVRTTDGRIFETSQYTVTNDEILAQQDELASLRLAIDDLDRKIASQRRELARTRAEARAIAPGQDRIRAQAREILSSGGVDAN